MPLIPALGEAAWFYNEFQDSHDCYSETLSQKKKKNKKP